MNPFMKVKQKWQYQFGTSTDDLRKAIFILERKFQDGWETEGSYWSLQPNGDSTFTIRLYRVVNAWRAFFSSEDGVNVSD